MRLPKSRCWRGVWSVPAVRVKPEVRPIGGLGRAWGHVFVSRPTWFCRVQPPSSTIDEQRNGAMRLRLLASAAAMAACSLQAACADYYPSAEPYGQSGYDSYAAPAPLYETPAPSYGYAQGYYGGGYYGGGYNGGGYYGGNDGHRFAEPQHDERRYEERRHEEGRRFDDERRLEEGRNEQQRQQQEQQSKSEPDTLAECEPGVEQHSQGDALQEQVQAKMAVATAVQEGQPAQAQVSGAEGTHGSTADSDADDNEDDSAEGRMMQEEQEASPAPAEARKSAQPSRRRQAAQRRSSPTPLASRAAGGASSGRKAAGKGGGGRGRAATPAARAAAVQKPRRSTSRSTAGKRRRSPS